MSPLDDGKTHINIYSQGKTRLGRTLSNFAHTPFELDGLTFQSVEGYWYWVQTKQPYLKELYGIAAKIRGKEYLKAANKKIETVSEEQLYRAYQAKLEAHPALRGALRSCKLPLEHYYVYGDKVVVPKEWQWTAKLWDAFR